MTCVVGLRGQTGASSPSLGMAWGRIYGQGIQQELLGPAGSSNGTATGSICSSLWTIKKKGGIDPFLSWKGVSGEGAEVGSGRVQSPDFPTSPAFVQHPQVSTDPSSCQVWQKPRPQHRPRPTLTSSVRCKEKSIKTRVIKKTARAKNPSALL